MQEIVNFTHSCYAPQQKKKRKNDNQLEFSSKSCAQVFYDVRINWKQCSNLGGLHHHKFLAL